MSAIIWVSVLWVVGGVLLAPVIGTLLRRCDELDDVAVPPVRAGRTGAAPAEGHATAA